MTGDNPSKTDLEIAETIARELAEAENPRYVTVRSLRDLFGRARLTASARRDILHALRSSGVVVEPSLEHALLDDEIVLRSASRSRPPGRGRNRLLGIGSRAWKGVVASCGLAGTLVGLYAFYEERTSNAPLKRLGGDLNVAIAPFSGGPAEEKVQGEQLSRQVRGTLAEQLERRGRATEVSFEIAPPPAIKSVEGATPDERATTAGEVARRLNADMVVYANLRVKEHQTVVVPSFFLSGRALGNAEELVGGHRLGGPITVDGSVRDSPAARADVRRRLATRTRILADFVVGLSHFAQRDYTEANRWFRDADATSTRAGGAAADVINLFLGHTAGRMRDLGQAQRFYGRALQADPRYARARFGIAEVRFQRAHHGCRPGRSDERGLRAALAGYLAVERERNTAYGALLSVRSRFGRARVLLCLSAARIDRRWADAEALFSQVVAAYETGERRLRDETSEALAAIGLIRDPTRRNAPQSELRTAATYYERALRLGPEKDRQAFFLSKLGSLYARLGNLAAADRAYRRATALDPHPGDQRRYEKARRTIKEN